MVSALCKCMQCYKVRLDLEELLRVVGDRFNGLSLDQQRNGRHNGRHNGQPIT